MAILVQPDQLSSFLSLLWISTCNPLSISILSLKIIIVEISIEIVLIVMFFIWGFSCTFLVGSVVFFCESLLLETWSWLATSSACCLPGFVACVFCFGIVSDHDVIIHSCVLKRWWFWLLWVSLSSRWEQRPLGKVRARLEPKKLHYDHLSSRGDGDKLWRHRCLRHRLQIRKPLGLAISQGPSKKGKNEKWWRS